MNGFNSAHHIDIELLRKKEHDRVARETKAEHDRIARELDQDGDEYRLREEEDNDRQADSFNMRFRAWDRENKRMLYDVLCGEGRVFIILGQPPDGGLGGEFRDYIPMQWTGLKDKNGKEIYELHEIDHKYRVIWYINKYVLQEISTGDIIEMYAKQNEREITGEYSPLEENQKGITNQYV